MILSATDFARKLCGALEVSKLNLPERDQTLIGLFKDESGTIAVLDGSTVEDIEIAVTFLSQEKLVAGDLFTKAMPFGEAVIGIVLDNGNSIQEDNMIFYLLILASWRMGGRQILAKLYELEAKPPTLTLMEPGGPN
ncbi:MAG: hypothetical protein MUO26_11440 [Methanotrichaceae archaeon]|nr:hypothetical protein [Methanotrichaceae archaeon]